MLYYWYFCIICYILARFCVPKDVDPIEYLNEVDDQINSIEDENTKAFAFNLANALIENPLFAEFTLIMVCIIPPINIICFISKLNLIFKKQIK